VEKVAASPEDIKQLFATHRAQRDTDLNGKPIWVLGDEWGPQHYSRPWA